MGDGSRVPPPKRVREPEREAGTIRPYRPAPHDFRETYLRMGWDGIDEHYRTNTRCIARWIEECGGDELRRERSAFTRCPMRNHNRSKRYVMGRTLVAKAAAAAPSSEV